MMPLEMREPIERRVRDLCPQSAARLLDNPQRDGAAVRDRRS